MGEVKCDHCGIEIYLKDAIPCTWEEIGLTWFYCRRCDEGVFGGNTRVENDNVIDVLKDKNVEVSFQ